MQAKVVETGVEVDMGRVDLRVIKKQRKKMERMGFLYDDKRFRIGGDSEMTAQNKEIGV